MSAGDYVSYLGPLQCRSMQMDIIDVLHRSYEEGAMTLALESGIIKEADALTRWMKRSSPEFAESFRILTKDKRGGEAIKQMKRNAISGFSGKNPITYKSTFLNPYESQAVPREYVPSKLLDKIKQKLKRKKRGTPLTEQSARGISAEARTHKLPIIPPRTKSVKGGVVEEGGVMAPAGTNPFSTKNTSMRLHELGHLGPSGRNEIKAWDDALTKVKKTNNPRLQERVVRDAKIYTHGYHGSVDNREFYRGKLKNPELRKLQRFLLDKDLTSGLGALRVSLLSLFIKSISGRITCGAKGLALLTLVKSLSSKNLCNFRNSGFFSLPL